MITFSEMNWLAVVVRVVATNVLGFLDDRSDLFLIAAKAKRPSKRRKQPPGA